MVGLIAIVLAVFALNLLPTRYAAFALILAAFVLFALEAKFVSYGVLGAGGVLCLIFGALLLVDGPIPEMRVKLLTALVVSVPLGVIAVFLMTLVLRAHKNPVVTGTRRDDRRDRRGAHGGRAGRQSVRARRAVEREGEERHRGGSARARARGRRDCA